MPVGPSASGPLRAGRLEAVLAQRREVDHEVDAVDHPLAEVVAPVEHDPQAKSPTGQNIRSASELAGLDADGLRTAWASGIRERRRMGSPAAAAEAVGGWGDCGELGGARIRGGGVA